MHFISGTRADKRPQFQKMIEDCHKGKIDMIITKSVSRFARNTVDCLDYVRSLKEIGVGVFFEEQNIDTLKSDSELYLVIYAGFAQSESESMKSTIGEAIGINGSSDEIDLLERRIDALNKRMLDLVSLSVQEGDDAENYEDDFKSISAQIDQLSKRITAIRESESEDGDLQARLKEIQDIIDRRRENKDTYDDSIVRQMVECIKVYHDGRLQIILGGGYELEEYLESKLG